MKKLLFVVLALCFISSYAFAQAETTVTIKGTIIDNACGQAHATDISEFIKTHPKTCALMPDCVASGYSIYADGKLSKFDKDSSAKIAEFLKKEDSKLDVEVVADKKGEELVLVSIENQK